MQLPDPIDDLGVTWHADPAASGLRWRAFLFGGDELIAYEGGDWEVRLRAANGQTVASHNAPDAECARAAAARVYTAITRRTPEDKR